MNAHYEKGRYFVPRRVPGEDAVFEPEGRCAILHEPAIRYETLSVGALDLLIDNHNNLIYDFVWLCPDDSAAKEEPPVSQSDVP